MSKDSAGDQKAFRKPGRPELSVVTSERSDGRGAAELRTLSIQSGGHPFADGSAEVRLGATRLLLAALIQPQGIGQVRTFLHMLPLSTRLRAPAGDLGPGALKEIRQIESLAGRALEHSLSSAGVTGLDIELHASVCHADGGVVAATVAGGWVAMYEALSAAAAAGLLNQDLDLPRVAAVSAGVVHRELRVDLLSDETTTADFHYVVLTSKVSGVIGIHAEGNALQSAPDTLHNISTLCLQAADTIYAAQAKAVV